MEIGQDAIEAAGGAKSIPAPENLLFVDMANQSEASQVSSRKKARSHIMSRHHRRVRMLRVS
jgi:hypothetical protein